MKFPLLSSSSASGNSLSRLSHTHTPTCSTHNNDNNKEWREMKKIVSSSAAASTRDDDDAMPFLRAGRERAKNSAPAKVCLREAYNVVVAAFIVSLSPLSPLSPLSLFSLLSLLSSSLSSLSSLSSFSLFLSLPGAYLSLRCRYDKAYDAVMPSCC